MNQADFQSVVGRQIRLHRKALGLSQEKLAEIAEVHPTYISNIERGKISASAYSFYKIAQALGIKLADIFCSLDVEVNSDLEKDFIEIVGKLKQLDDAQQGFYLAAIKGMLPK